MDRITNIYKDLFENPVGRISRADYWIIFFFNFFVVFVLAIFSDMLFALVALFVYVADILFSIKRYHDSGRKGWWILCPLANFIFLFYNSTEDNEWGPKENPI